MTLNATYSETYIYKTNLLNTNYVIPTQCVIYNTLHELKQPNSHFTVGPFSNIILHAQL